MKPKRHSRPKFDLSPLDFEETLNSPALTGIRECLQSLTSPTRGGEDKQVAPVTVEPTVSLSTTVVERDTVPLLGKLRKAVLAQDGHSSGEEMLYQALWRNGKPETENTRIITAGWDRMSKLARLTPRNTKLNCNKLVQKLSLEVTAEEDSFRRIGRTYRVFSYGRILERRKAAGMEWIRKTRGVEFVDGPIEKGTVSLSTTVVEKGGDTVVERDRDTVVERGTLLDSSSKRKRKTSSSAVAETDDDGPIVELFRRELPTDDEAVRRLVQACREVDAAATGREIAHFTALKLSQIRAMRSVRNPMGFLIEAVPKCFRGDLITDLRAGDDLREREMESLARSVLEDAEADPQERLWAQTILAGR